MALKAVCVLKGTGEVTGTVFFEQEVNKNIYFVYKGNTYMHFETQSVSMGGLVQLANVSYLN